MTPGTRIGPYEIVSPLGAGGMGEVYRARDTKLKREVAIKVLPTDVANDRERLARFQREAEVLASLNHPHIAHVYGIEESALVMELVEGEDLSQRIARGAIPLDEALPIAKQIAEALEAAHDAGIVHRDLKPANVKVRDDGTVKVLDFGLAKALDLGSGIKDQGSVANSPTITSPANTMRGVILGTAAYMAPEQAKGKAVDKRADIWAFGCVLYEMLTGTRAFKGDDVTDIITSVMRDAPDWNALPAGTPASIRTLLRRCLEKDPRKRAPHIAVARLEIDEAMTSTGDLVQGVANPAQGRSSRWLPAATVVATAIALAAGWGWGRYSAPQAPPAAPLHFKIDGPLAASFAQRITTFVSVSPDGRQIAYVGQPRARAATVWLHSFHDGTTRELENTVGAAALFWSPDSKYLAFQAGQQLRRVDVATGAVNIIAESGGGGGGGTWNRDGVILVGDNAISRVPAGGGTPQPITKVDTAKGDLRHTRPRFLPDGRRFLFAALNRESGNSALHLGELGSDQTRVLADIASGADYVNPGYLVYALKGSLMARPFDAATAEWNGDPVVISETVRQQSIGAAAFSASPGGVIAYDATSMFGQELELAWVGRDGRVTGTLGTLAGGHAIALAADDNSVAVEQGAGIGKNAVWLLDGTRSTRTRLTFEKGAQGHPVWSPDSRRVVYFDGQPGSMTRLWIKPANGTGDAEPLIRGDDPTPATLQASDWSRDGRIVVYDELARGNFDLKYIDLNGNRTPATAIGTPSNERLGQLSPDARLIVYESDETGQSDIYVATFPDGATRWMVSNRGGAKPRWNSNGREIVFVDPLGMLQSVAIDLGGGFRAGLPVAMFPLGGIDTDGFNYAMSRDGTRFLVMRPSEKGPPPRVSVIVNWPATIR